MDKIPEWARKRDKGKPSFVDVHMISMWCLCVFVCLCVRGVCGCVLPYLYFTKQLQEGISLLDLQLEHRDITTDNHILDDTTQSHVVQ